MKVSIYEYNEQEHMRMEREDAFEDGRKAGLNQLFELMNKMTADGLGHQIHRLASEPDFYQEMARKYLK